jgi:hypothetical protein
MYSTFLTASPGSVLFSRSTLLKRKDLCFSCLRLGLIRHRRSLRSSHLSSQVVHDFFVDLLRLFQFFLSVCFSCSNESNQKAIRDRSWKVEISRNKTKNDSSTKRAHTPLHKPFLHNLPDTPEVIFSCVVCARARVCGGEGGEESR